GQAAVIATAGGAQAVVDCGSLQGGRRAARALADSLAQRRVDLLVITHADTDHHNGLAALLQRVSARRAVLPASMAGSPAHARIAAHVSDVTLLEAGSAFQAGDVCVRAPRVPEGAGDNDRSLWVRASLPGADVLLSGDAQELGVAAAIAQGIAAPADVLLLPHHGRPNRNLPHLLAVVRPRACLASAAGADGDTALGAVARRFGAEVWSTGRHGHLRFDGAAVHAAQAPALLAPADRPR
ncbi:MAG: ComEC/Rec2 family competence protein, partial [Planctomycetota bacterium]